MMTTTTVAKLRIDANLPVDPTDTDAVLKVAEIVGMLRQQLKESGARDIEEQISFKTIRTPAVKA